MNNPGNHKKNMDNLFNSIYKFFNPSEKIISLSKLNRFFYENDYKNLIVLSYDCLDLDLVNNCLSNSSFLMCHKFFNISVPKSNCLEELMHCDLFDKINSIDGCRAYGVFPFGDVKYDSLDDAYEQIINFSNGSDKRLIYASFKGQYEANKFGLNKIDSDCKKLCERLDNSVILIISESLDDDKKVPLFVVKRMLSSEVCRLAVSKDFESVNLLLRERCNCRCLERADIFSKRIFFSKEDFNNYSSVTSQKKCFVYEISEEIVGFILFNISLVNGDDFLLDRSYLKIEHIYVKKDYRRRGIGTKLYQAVLQYSKKIRTKRVEFEVYSFEEDLIEFISSLDFDVKSINFEKKID